MTILDITGRYAINRGPLDSARVDGGAWHHSVTPTPTVDISPTREVQILDSIDAYHRGLHWTDAAGNRISLGGFAYHLAVFPSRRAYYVTPLSVRGAHVAGHNGHLIGVVLIGTFTVNPPVRSQLDTAVEARIFAEAQLHNLLTWRGHRDWADPRYPTACPGATYAQWVPGISGPQEDDMPKLMRATDTGHVYIVGESGKRHINDAVEFALSEKLFGPALAVTQAEADTIPDVPSR